MTSLTGLTPEEIAAALGEPSYRGRQIFSWIARGAESFEAMTDLPQALRRSLEDRRLLRSTAVSRVLRDKDGTAKLQITLADGLRIEAVLLTGEQGRQTACLSTQAGCPAGCVFCKTGSLGFRRNLDPGEILEQFLHIRSLAPGTDHIVIMGMGEPLLNLGALEKALGLLRDPRGLGLSPRRITISTSGILPGLRALAEKPPCRLALSLTAPEEALRARLMPITRTNPLGEVREALVRYQQKQRITLEMVLLSGVNTRREDAEALARFVREPPALDAVVNLIPWNPVEGLLFEGHPLRSPRAAEIASFAGALETRGLRVTRRFRRGTSIAGACGQLGG